MNIEENIALYPVLSDEERAAVDAFVESHPEWRPALEDARLWDELLRATRILEEDPPGQEALAYYAMTRDISLEDIPPGVADTVKSLRRRIEGDPELAERVRAITSRIAAIESESPAGSHFQRLTGHDLHDLDDLSSVDEINGGASAVKQRSVHAKVSSWPLWRVAATIAALVALYGVLLIAGHLMRPQHERLAAFEAHEVSLEGYDILRGDAQPNDTEDTISRYLEALYQLRRAERSFLGLFPSFVPERLDSAATLLRDVIDREPAASFLSNEAVYLLGKTELARGNVDAASEAFEQVISFQGLRADDAQRILSELDR